MTPTPSLLGHSFFLPFKEKDKTKDDLKLIYIAGKYTDRTNLKIEQNILKAKEAAIELAKNGWIYYCPHLNSAMFHIEDIPDDFWYDHGLKILSKCDTIFMLDGWEDSKGAITEFRYAQELGLEIFFETDGYPTAPYGFER